MERLTERESYWLGEEFWTSVKEPNDEEIDNVYEKLKEYEDLEEQGLLLRVPCKVGDTVYTNTRVVGWYMRDKDKPYKAIVVFIGINGNGVDNFITVVFENDNMLQFKFSDFGKTVFLTREEAEAALKKMNKTDVLEE